MTSRFELMVAWREPIVAASSSRGASVSRRENIAQLFLSKHPISLAWRVSSLAALSDARGVVDEVSLSVFTSSLVCIQLRAIKGFVLVSSCWSQFLGATADGRRIDDALPVRLVKFDIFEWNASFHSFATRSAHTLNMRQRSE